eukprot:358163-Chlamydomonas_euryale.AAC.6
MEGHWNCSNTVLQYFGGLVHHARIHGMYTALIASCCGRCLVLGSMAAVGCERRLFQPLGSG